MKVSVVQANLAWRDRERNFGILGDLISTVGGVTDLVILPEMFNSGFTISPTDVAESPDGPTLKWMKAMATSGGHAVCGSYIVSEDGRFFNRFVFVSPGSSEIVYDKRHLFSMGGEDKLFERGGKRVVFTYLGMRISPFICYDLRFPVWMRNRNDYDLAIIVANWPAARINVWNTLIRARAIENQCFVAGANRTGTDGEGISYTGSSCIVDARGDSIAEAGDVDGIITADLQANDLELFRQKFPVWKDADDFILQ